MSVGVQSDRLGRVCSELERYGIAAEPSAEKPCWIVIHAPSSAFTDSALSWSAPTSPEVYVSDNDLLRSDCVEIVLGKVTSVVGHPC